MATCDFELNIPYKRGYLKKKFLFSILWLLVGIGMVASSPSNLFFYGYPFIGAAYTAVYWYEKRRGYLKICDAQLCVFSLPTKNYTLTELNQAYQFAGDLVLKFPTRELRIDTYQIEEHDREKLTTTIERYVTDSIPDKTPSQSGSLSVK